MVNECSDGTHSCNSQEICNNLIVGFECKNKEKMFESKDRFIISSTIEMNSGDTKKVGALATDYNFKLTLGNLSKKSRSIETIATMASTSETLIEIKLRTNSESTSSVAPFIIDIDLYSQFQVELFITSPEKKNEINVLQQCIGQDCLISVSLNGINALESSNPVAMIHAGTSAQTFAHVKSLEIINAQELDQAVCEPAPLVENLWLVDGTGSYKSYRGKAKEEFIKNWEYLLSDDPNTKLGLAFFADRDHDFGCPLEELYHVALNLKPVKDITLTEIGNAFEQMNQMGGGGDSPEDQLLGLVFSIDQDRISWSTNARVRLISLFTDVEFHYKGDTKDAGRIDAPLRSWWSPQPDYRYHDPIEVSKLVDQAVDNLVIEPPFSLDFYITSKGTANKPYELYFVDGYEDISWFLVRKAFISSSIDDSFGDKMNQMNNVMTRARDINDRYQEKCEEWDENQF